MSNVVYICEACGEILDQQRQAVVEAAKLLPAGGGDVLESPTSSSTRGATPRAADGTD